MELKLILIKKGRKSRHREILARKVLNLDIPKKLDKDSIKPFNKKLSVASSGFTDIYYNENKIIKLETLLADLGIMQSRDERIAESQTTFYNNRLAKLNNLYKDKIIGVGEHFSNTLHNNSCEIFLEKGAKQNFYYKIKNIKHINNKRYKAELEIFEDIEFEYVNPNVVVWHKKKRYYLTQIIKNKLEVVNSYEDCFLEIDKNELHKQEDHFTQELNRQEKIIDEKIQRMNEYLKDAVYFEKDIDAYVQFLQAGIDYVFIKKNYEFSKYSDNNEIRNYKPVKCCGLSKYFTLENDKFFKDNVVTDDSYAEFPYYYTLRKFYDLKGTFLYLEKRHTRMRAWEQSEHAKSRDEMEKLGFKANFLNGRIFMLFIEKNKGSKKAEKRIIKLLKNEK